MSEGLAQLFAQVRPGERQCILAAPSVLSWKLVEEKKDVEIVVRQGANRSDSRCYREDLQRSMAAILGIFMKQTFNSGH